MSAVATPNDFSLLETGLDLLVCKTSVVVAYPMMGVLGKTNEHIFISSGSYERRIIVSRFVTNSFEGSFTLEVICSKKSFVQDKMWENDTFSRCFAFSAM